MRCTVMHIDSKVSSFDVLLTTFYILLHIFYVLFSIRFRTCNLFGDFNFFSLLSFISFLICTLVEFFFLFLYYVFVALPLPLSLSFLSSFNSFLYFSFSLISVFLFLPFSVFPLFQSCLLHSLFLPTTSLSFLICDSVSHRPKSDVSSTRPVSQLWSLYSDPILSRADGVAP